MNIVTDSMGMPIKVNYSSLRTLTGLTLDQALKTLQGRLDNAAYKKVSVGGREFTDIKPAWQTEVFTKVFGLCGVGWYFGFNEPEISGSTMTSKSNREYTLWQADLKGWLIYVLTDGEQLFKSEPVWATGGSDNETKEYAVRGALTNMLGAAASKLCWQLFVYKDQPAPPKEEEESKRDDRPWYRKALDFAHGDPKLWPTELGSTDPGRKAISLLRGMVGPQGWFAAQDHLMRAVGKYTGYMTPEEMTWADLEKLVRVYAGPFAVAGQEVRDVLFFHYISASDWQNILASIPLMEGFVLDEQTADALNVVIGSAPAYVKNKKMDTEAVAAQLRNHFIKIAVDETPVAPVDLASQTEIPY